MKDTFKFILPAELSKSEDGEWKVRGLASTESIDHQGETIIQKGVDLTPIDQKRGILNWDHQRGPENTIGILDGYNRSGNGLFVEGRLFKNHSKAKAVREIMESLGEGDRGRMGLSVEGKIVERDKFNPKIIKKCQINAVALTMNPVNAQTYADLVKSMNAAEEIEFDSTETHIIDEHVDEPVFTAGQVMVMIQKALGTGAGATAAAGQVMIQKALGTGAGATAAPAERTGGDALATEDLEKRVGPRIQEADDSKVNKAVKMIRSKFRVDRVSKQTISNYLRNYGDLNSTEVKKAMEKLYKARLRAMSADLFKSNMVEILDKLQVLYPYNSRSEIWEAMKDRLQTKYPELEDFGKGGPGSGRRGHKTDKPSAIRRTPEERKEYMKREHERIMSEGGYLTPEEQEREWAKEDREERRQKRVKKGFRLKQESAKEKEHALYEDARQRGDYEENKDKTRAQLKEIAEQSGAEKKEKQKIRVAADAAKQVGDRDHVRPGVEN